LFTINTKDKIKLHKENVLGNVTMEEQKQEGKSIFKIFLEKGYLLDKEMLSIFSHFDENFSKEIVMAFKENKIQERVITKAGFLKNIEKLNQIIEEEKYKAIKEEFYLKLGFKKEENKEQENSKQAISEKITNGKEDVRVLYAPLLIPKKVSIEDFVNHFRARYNQIKGMLMERDLENLSSLRKIGNNRDSYSVIVCVISKRITSNKNIILDVEDLSGRGKILINKNKTEVYTKAKDLLLDDIIAFKVSGNSEILFANEIYFPDSVLQEKKYGKKEEWVVFSSDFHVGSKMFLKKNLMKFINWLNGDEGGEKQREIARKVRYLFLTGDNVDGVGVYPDQEANLSIKDIREQYKELAEILKMIRKDVTIIMCPGQHDGVRVAEPQPAIGDNVAPELLKMKNLILVTNPALIEVSGFKVLIYHGASMHGVVNEIEELRTIYKHHNPTRIVKELLKRRHLATTHGSVIYIPSEKEDPLVIREIPDIVATGDLHRPEISSYNNILLVASSCWQSITPFEEKVGNEPDPCKVPLFNMKTREVKILDFSQIEEDEKQEIKGETCENGKQTELCKLEANIEVNNSGKNIKLMGANQGGN